MSENKEVSKDPKKNNSGGVSAATVEIEQQERMDQVMDQVEEAARIAKRGSRMAELFIKTSRRLEGWEQRVAVAEPEELEEKDLPRQAKATDVERFAHLLSCTSGDSLEAALRLAVAKKKARAIGRRRRGFTVALKNLRVAAARFATGEITSDEFYDTLMGSPENVAEGLGLTAEELVRSLDEI